METTTQSVLEFIPVENIPIGVAGEKEKESKFTLGPGILKPIFKAIKTKMGGFKRSKDRLCILLFMDSPIKRHVDYWAQKDCLVGFEDDGFSRSSQLADTVTVFMLRGVLKRWKQLVGFAFTDSKMPLANLNYYYKEIAMEAKRAGLEIIASVCPYRHMEAIDLLLKETKEDAELNGEQLEENTIVIGAQKIVPLFDSSGLILAIREVLLEKDIIFKKSPVKWSYIEQAHRLANKNRYFPVMLKLSSDHVDAKKIDKNNIFSCMDTFTTILGSYIFHVSSNRCDNDSETFPLEAKDTGLFLLFLGHLYESITQYQIFKGSSHFKVWEESKRGFAEIEIPGDDYQIVNLWCRTLDGLLSIAMKLFFAQGYSMFPLNSFNCDPLENYLDILRHPSPRKLIPTCKLILQFFYKSLFIKNISVCYSPALNRKCDDLSFFVLMKHIEKHISAEKQKDDWKPPLIPKGVSYVDETVLNFIIRYLRKHVLKEVCCAVCLRNLCRPNVASIKIFKNLTEEVSLNLIKESILKAMIEMHFHVAFIMPSVIRFTGVYEKVLNYLKTGINLHLEKCPHVEKLKEKLMDNFGKSLIRENVRMFRKSIPMDTDDMVTNSDEDYWIVSALHDTY